MGKKKLLATARDLIGYLFILPGFKLESIELEDKLCPPPVYEVLLRLPCKTFFFCDMHLHLSHLVEVILQSDLQLDGLRYLVYKKSIHVFTFHASFKNCLKKFR